MKPMLMILTVACVAAGCSSAPVKEPPAVQPKPAVEVPRVMQTFPPPMREIVVEPNKRPSIEPSIVVDPLNDPNSLLANRSIYFDLDSVDIKSLYQSLIKAHAGYLVAHPTKKVRIEGNCDERGSREYNLALGQRRAAVISSSMKLLGAVDGQIEIITWGEEKPKAFGHDESAWSENRRGDIVYEKSP